VKPHVFLHFLMILCVGFVFSGCGKVDDDTAGGGADVSVSVEVQCSPDQNNSVAKCRSNEIDGKIAVMTIKDESGANILIREWKEIKCEQDPTVVPGRVFKKCQATFTNTSSKFLPTSPLNDPDPKFYVIEAYIDMEVNSSRSGTLKRGNLIFQSSGSVGRSVILSNGQKLDIRMGDVGTATISGGWTVF